MFGVKKHKKDKPSTLYMQAIEFHLQIGCNVVFRKKCTEYMKINLMSVYIYICSSEIVHLRGRSTRIITQIPIVQTHQTMYVYPGYLFCLVYNVENVPQVISQNTGNVYPFSSWTQEQLDRNAMEIQYEEQPLKVEKEEPVLQQEAIKNQNQPVLSDLHLKEKHEQFYICPLKQPKIDISRQQGSQCKNYQNLTPKIQGDLPKQSNENPGNNLFKFTDWYGSVELPKKMVKIFTFLRSIFRLRKSSSVTFTCGCKRKFKIKGYCASKVLEHLRLVHNRQLPPGSSHIIFRRSILSAVKTYKYKYTKYRYFTGFSSVKNVDNTTGWFCPCDPDLDMTKKDLFSHIMQVHKGISPHYIMPKFKRPKRNSD